MASTDDVRETAAPLQPWQDTTLPTSDRVEALLAAMTLREKTAQLYGVWVGASDSGGDVAPYQHDMSSDLDLDQLLADGLGQLTRPFGSAPVDPATGLISLARTQQRIMRESRFGIPAIAHEECLAGFTAWGATAYPVPLSWGATFNPGLIAQMSGRIGRSMRSVGIHQGLAPVLDVTRDARWGRVEETIGEDPMLVATVALAYVQGLEESGIIATLKHFIGYSASKAGRNLAPVSMGRREFNDVMVPPFELAVRDSGVRSVMHSYTDIDGVPSAGDEALLTGLLRKEWGFEGTVVADYFGVAFLNTLHRVAEGLGDAAAQALTAGVDVELPTVKAFGEPLQAEIEAGRFSEEFINRALRRVLAQKIELGMLDPGYSPLPAGWSEEDMADPDTARGRISLDTAEDRALARQVAEQAVVLLANNGTLPLAAPAKIAVIGPNAHDALNLLGCYSFPGHVGTQHPEWPMGVDIPTILDAVRAEYPAAEVVYAQGVAVDDDDESGIPAALAAADGADLVLAVLGDRPGLFGRGTSGEGCDASSLQLPGAQWALLDALLGTPAPVVTVVVSGRPYFLGDAPERSAAVLQAFFPGEEGAGAVAGILSGRVSPSGRLPVSIPSSPHSQPNTYLAAPLAQASGVSNVDPTARFPFGHGLTYTSFEWSEASVDASVVPTDGVVRASVSVQNTGEADGVEIVQLYLHDPVASVVRPVQRLIGYARVELAAGAAARVGFEVSADLAAFTGRSGTRIVEPGEIELRFGASSGTIHATAPVRLEGPVRDVDHHRTLTVPVTVSAMSAGQLPAATEPAPLLS